MQTAGCASGLQGPAARQLTNAAKRLACGLLNAFAWAVKNTVLPGPNRHTVPLDCAALADAPPEQGLRFLTTLTQLVGFGELVGPAIQACMLHAFP